MSKTKKKSKKALVLSALQAGKGVTRKSAETRFGVVNLRATISDLRKNDGYDRNILTNENKDGSVKYTWKN